jgi:hypothetical protein
MSRRTRFVLITFVVLAVIAAGWVGCGSLLHFVRVMHGGH